MGVKLIFESSPHSMPSSVINSLCLTPVPLHLLGLQGFSMWGLGGIVWEREEQGWHRRKTVERLKVRQRWVEGSRLWAQRGVKRQRKPGDGTETGAKGSD